MNLFIETPQQQAQRLASASGALTVEGARGLFSGVQRPARTMDDAAGASGREGSARAEGARVDAERGDAARGSAVKADVVRTDTARASAVASGAPGPAPVCEAPSASAEPYSIAQEAYRRELDHDRKRTRRHRRGIALRILLTIVLVPVLLFLAFVASYTLTCVLNGATPEELLQLMTQLFDQIQSYLALVTG